MELKRLSQEIIAGTYDELLEEWQKIFNPMGATCELYEENILVHFPDVTEKAIALPGVFEMRKVDMHLFDYSESPENRDWSVGPVVDEPAIVKKEGNRWVRVKKGKVSSQKIKF